jgi:hypothetical protein
LTQTRSQEWWLAFFLIVVSTIAGRMMLVLVFYGDVHDTFSFYIDLSARKINQWTSLNACVSAIVIGVTEPLPLK